MRNNEKRLTHFSIILIIIVLICRNYSIKITIVRIVNEINYKMFFQRKSQKTKWKQLDCDQENLTYRRQKSKYAIDCIIADLPLSLIRLTFNNTKHRGHIRLYALKIQTFQSDKIVARIHWVRHLNIIHLYQFLIRV